MKIIRAETTTERLTKIALIALFFLAAWLASSVPIALSPWQWGAFCLATLRLGRMLAFERVAEPIRAALGAITVDDQTEPAGTGYRHALSELITCPLCSGTWAALGLQIGLRIDRPLFDLTIGLFAAVEVAEVLHEVIELICRISDTSRK